MRKLETAMCLGLILSIFLGSLSGFTQKVNDLQKQVLRLHILANSDSAADQQLKLLVRDELLAQSEKIFSGCETCSDMKQRISEQKDYIQKIAETVLQEHGCQDSVSVQFVHMPFEQRVYEQFTMPAGTYDALRILIGNAEGHNWWCVMYPPLCLPAAEPETYFDDETTDILQSPQKYEIRFKCAELWNQFFQQTIFCRCNNLLKCRDNFSVQAKYFLL